MWKVEVGLTRLEQRLLRTWEVRRLQFVAHAGAAALATHQTYSRLEHSLGLFALTAHFAPKDVVARVTALLHDVGHLPFSHTFEGVAGLNHHALGEERIRGLAPLLCEHDMDADEVLAAASGERPSVLHSSPGALKLDHVESFVRSGQAHGRLVERPSTTLERLRIVDGVVNTDPATATYLAELAAGEAGYLCSWEGCVTNGVVRGLVTRLLRDRGGSSQALIQQIPHMTDSELWNVLANDLATAEHAQRLLRDPLAWELITGHREDLNGYPYEVRRLYLDMPCVDGTPIDPPRSARQLLKLLPWRCTIVPADRE
ncbi:hypothetical protein FHR84_000823 [Actinopolyspora biskrensis]|uniref:HD domain-containing protein n=1 Tax=Actinopolyspora biskrensis TaxID=1470178 RepID=A0A852YVB2_9ACTN|nr:HD domain-containing protein [Actinopolyspora biskrensis]NYH77509.1 hypothetical protein [Actinopolyspora biskrensis]